MPRYEASPRISLIACASVGALVGVLLAVLVGLVHPLQVEPSATPLDNPLATRIAPPPAAGAASLPRLAATSLPAPAKLAPEPVDESPPAPARHRAAPRRVDPCLDATRPDCRRVFEAALGSMPAAAPPVAGAAGLDPGDAVADDASAGEPLHFSSKPEWMRRLDRLGREGLPFVRMPRGPDRELVIGINRKGVLGAFLVETPGSPATSSTAPRAGAGELAGDTAGVAGYSAAFRPQDPAAAGARAAVD